MIGDKIKQRLDYLGLTQRDFAYRLNISPSTLNGYITGYRTPDIHTLKKISEELKVSSAYFLDSIQPSNFDGNTEGFYLDMKNFADRFKMLRLEKVLTQEQLADLFYLNKSSISRYESGKQIPEPQMIQKFADFFNVSIDFLLARTNNRHQEQSSDNSKILNAVRNDPELFESVKELSERESMQLLFKQVKPLSDDEIARVMRIIKAIEDEEDRQDGV